LDKNPSTILCEIATKFFVHPKNGSASNHAMTIELYVELSLPQQTAAPLALQWPLNYLFAKKMAVPLAVP
jgi:hypothetical protein